MKDDHGAEIETYIGRVKAEVRRSGHLKPER
jgi:hypothetical protein